jgi:hypothetical protein
MNIPIFSKSQNEDPKCTLGGSALVSAKNLGETIKPNEIKLVPYLDEDQQVPIPNEVQINSSFHENQLTSLSNKVQFE